MTTIHSHAGLIATLQTRLAHVRRRGVDRAPARALPSHVAEAAAASLAQRIAAIDRRDPDRRRKAVRVVLEAELARSFGAGLLNDPVFPQMLDAVQEQMQADAQAAAAVQALGDFLLAAPA